MNRVVTATFLLSAVLTIWSGCVGIPRNGFTLQEWLNPDLQRREYITPPAPEVLYVASELFVFEKHHHRWPKSAVELAGEINDSPYARSFVLRNVTVVSHASTIKVVVWDLLLRRNTVTADQSGRIWIYSQEFGTGDRSLMHNRQRKNEDFIDMILENMHGS